MAFGFDDLLGGIQAVGTIGSALISGYSAKSAQENQTSINRQQMAFGREQMSWQRQNYRNRHQWQVEDMRKAGLNPILSATYGGGNVGSPVGLPKLGNPASAGADAMSSVMSSAKEFANLGLTKALTTKAYADANSAQSISKIKKAISQITTGARDSDTAKSIKMVDNAIKKGTSFLGKHSTTPNRDIRSKRLKRWSGRGKNGSRGSFGTTGGW